MDNPSLYLLALRDEPLIPATEDDFTIFSNLDWGKEQAAKDAKSSRKSRIIYKLVPIFEVEVEFREPVFTAREIAKP